MSLRRSHRGAILTWNIASGACGHQASSGRFSSAISPTNGISSALRNDLAAPRNPRALQSSAFAQQPTEIRETDVGVGVEPAPLDQGSRCLPRATDLGVVELAGPEEIALAHDHPDHQRGGLDG